MSDAMTPCKPDDPLLIAFNTWKSSERFPICRQWALVEQHVEGSLWEAFIAGRSSVEKEPSGRNSLNLQMALALLGDPDDPLGSFERIGDWYYRDTRSLRPGKSEPMETGRDSNSDENRKRFSEWYDSKRRELIKKCLSSHAPESSSGSGFHTALQNELTQVAEQFAREDPESTDQNFPTMVDVYLRPMLAAVAAASPSSPLPEGVEDSAPLAQPQSDKN